MKNFSLVLNTVLLVLVAYLFYLHFSGSPRGFQKSGNIGKDSSSHHGNKIAYLDIDSLQNNYEYYKKIKLEFDRRQAASNEEIAGMQKKYQNRAMQLQQKGPTMSQQEQENAMREINQMQQDLQTKKQSLDNELFNYNSKMKEDILSRIQNYLKIYNMDGRYDYILSYEPGFMFYKDSALNITRDVIKGLNDEYMNTKK